MPYITNAFINCPFDKVYRVLLERLIFILVFYEFDVLMSTNKSSADDRLLNIIDMIKNSKFTFHDLSRHKVSKKGDYARFNMPFELGIDFGCIYYGRNRKDKIIAILDSTPHAYDRHLSDMSGRDIIYHLNNPELLFEIIPTWLRHQTDNLYDSPKRLKTYYIAWVLDYKASLKELGYDLRTISNVDIGLYQNILKAWVPVWKAANNYVMP